MFEHLMTTYETEAHHTPLEVLLKAEHLADPECIEKIIRFIKEPRKCLFLFQIPDNKATSNQLALLARRAILNHTATTLLQNTSNEPKINPLKQALATKTPLPRARIQIQKNYTLPKPPVKENTHSEQIEQEAEADLNLIPVHFPELPELERQLKALGIEQTQDIAREKISQHLYAFRDGIVPGHLKLPQGFYIKDKALCYTDSPKRSPGLLAPLLQQPEQLTLPSHEDIEQALEYSQEQIEALLNPDYSEPQHKTLTSLFRNSEYEFKSLINSLKILSAAAPNAVNIKTIIPFLCKQFLLGGEAHTLLLMRLLNTCINKKINLDFILLPQVQNACLSTRGIKNLQKLVQLSSEQKEWWNTLIRAHLNYDQDSLDFNAFFEGYTQAFLPAIAEKKLTLPNPCPIHHNGHFLITLNRVQDVLVHAQNPQEQCRSLSNLNWGPTGVHYAMMQKPEGERLKQVSECMQLQHPEDTLTDPSLIYLNLEQENLALKPWLYRYMGQHWKSTIRLIDIETQLLEIQKLSQWTFVQKNQLTFILTCTFSDKSTQNPQEWKETLNKCIALLQNLNSNDRDHLLKTLSNCFKFKPNPSLTQINYLINQSIQLKTAIPDRPFNELLTPLVSCLEHEGFNLLNTVQERIQKTKTPFAPALNSFLTLLHTNRAELGEELSILLAKVNEPQLTQAHKDSLTAFKRPQRRCRL
jgi:hypothetical protein